MLDPKLFEKIINELKHNLTYLTFYFQGEPFIHPSFLDLVKVASDARVYTATSTNGHFLNESVAKKVVESGLDRLIISLDGTSQETYEKYRIGGSLSKVMEGTKNVVKWKKKLGSSKPHIIFQFLIVRHNEHQIEEVKKLADTAGANEVKLKTAQIYDYEKGSPLMPSHEKYSRYKKNKDGSYSIKNTLGNSCWRMWHSCVITWDGKVVPCCFDKDAEFVLGEVEKEDFARLWKNDSYKNFRKTLLTSRSQIEMCKNCSEGSQVWQ
jgi:radical SAM protein with 4Fe4S-binding SPASM domain